MDAWTAVISCKRNGRTKSYTHEFPWLTHFAPEEAGEILSGIVGAMTGKQYSTQRVAIRSFGFLAEWLAENSPPATFDREDINEQMTLWLESFLDRDSNSEYLRRHQDWAALRQCLLRMLDSGRIKNVELPPIDPKASKLAEITRKASIPLYKLKLSDNEKRQLEKPDDTDRAFFQVMEAKTNELVRTIRSAAKEQILQAVRDFEEGRRLIAKCDIRYLRSIVSNTSSLDPKVLGIRGHAISAFSPAHPNYKENILGWAYHENGSVLYDRAWRGANQFKKGELDWFRRRLGMTLNVVAPLFAFLTLDTAFNVVPLEEASIEVKARQIEIVHAPDGTTRIRMSLPKYRGKRLLKEVLKPDATFGAKEALEFALQITAAWRSPNGPNELWLHHGSRRRKAITPLSSTGFKGSHDAFMESIPNLAKHLLPKAKISRKDLRILSGYAEWLRTGGDVIATAKRLHNRPITALRRYIPNDLKEALYRVRFRRFHTTLILAATINERDLAKRALKFRSIGELNQQFDELIKHPRLGKSPLMKAALSSDKSGAQVRSTTKHLFVASIQNVALLFRLVRHIEELQLNRPDISVEKELLTNFDAKFWRELLIEISHRMPNSLDRDMRRVFESGKQLASSASFDVSFPCLTARSIPRRQY